jgi:hypothetical protein
MINKSSRNNSDAPRNPANGRTGIFKEFISSLVLLFICAIGVWSVYGWGKNSLFMQMSADKPLFVKHVNIYYVIKVIPSFNVSSNNDSVCHSYVVLNNLDTIVCDTYKQVGDSVNIVTYVLNK